jgi:hypothetical protein
MKIPPIEIGEVVFLPYRIRYLYSVNDKKYEIHLNNLSKINHIYPKHINNYKKYFSPLQANDPCYTSSSASHGLFDHVTEIIIKLTQQSVALYKLGLKGGYKEQPYCLITL